MKKEMLYKFGAGIAIFLFAGIFMPCIFLEPFHQNEILLLIGFLGVFSYAMMSAYLVLWHIPRNLEDG